MTDEGPRPITPAGYAKLERELQDLWHQERPKLVNEVADAAALGDRSENAEYIFGKKRLREIDRRIKYLSKLLDRLQVIDPKRNEKEQADFGATVHVEDEDGNAKRYTLVGEDEIEAKQGRISLKSPIGRALLGKMVGDEVTVRRPKGEVELVIERIEYL
ncbi:MAG: transcription elongation factor GreB [Myxococcota bacterium]